MNILGERLRTFANTLGGVTKLADLLGISQPRLSQFISGARDLNTKILSDLRGLGCNINWLLTGEPEEKEIKNLKNENKKLKEINYTLLDEATKFNKVAEKLGKKYAVKKKK